ncbi:MAG: hypothetical protein FWF59_12815 [Turicibacter sp.]|nr:hypothetical protein [Turicibacter sp.]
MKLDHLGQFYASLDRQAHPGYFSITAHLKEAIDPEVLKAATTSLGKRYPHLNVRIKSGLFWYRHERMEGALTPQCTELTSQPAKAFKKGEALTRILHGDKHLTMEVHHSVCDGRSLSKMISSLLEHYFKLLGNSSLPVTLPHPDEAIDGYRTHADLRKTPSHPKKKAYVPYFQPADPKTISRTYDLNALKTKAKSFGLNVTEYLSASILRGFSKMRALEGLNHPITMSIPVDCRRFFPTACLRNFVTAKSITMVESDDFIEVAKGIGKQLGQIDGEFIQEKISEMERLAKFTDYVPLFIKKHLIRLIGTRESAGYTTILSNLGNINLTDEVSRQVDHLSFALGAEPGLPYQFGCVATGNRLTLTATTVAEDNQVVKDILDSLAT